MFKSNTISENNANVREGFLFFQRVMPLMRVQVSSEEIGPIPKEMLSRDARCFFCPLECPESISCICFCNEVLVLQIDTKPSTIDFI